MYFALRPKSSGLFLDLAPLVDMVFLLLVFFMIGARFFRPVIDLELPQAKARAQADQTAIVVTINREGNLFLDKQPTELRNLAKQIRENIQKKDRSDIILQADQKIPFQLFVQTMEQLREGGASNLNIETSFHKAKTPKRPDNLRRGP